MMNQRRHRCRSAMRDTVVPEVVAVRDTVTPEASVRDALRRRLEILAFVLLCSFGSVSAAWQVRDWGDALSRVDPFSEANAIREVRNFLDTGITANDGLGNVLRPGLYTDQGFQGFPVLRAESVTQSGVHTHYAPGPEYLLYAAMRLLGPHPISRLRILPLIITWAAAVFF